jgi:hypothetical protein
MAVTQLLDSSWTRKHDLPGAPLFPAAPKIYFPTSLQDLIEICKSRPAGERLKAAGSHWALSTAAVSDTAFIETHDPLNRFPSMDQTRYDIVPKCLHPKIIEALKNQHPQPFNTTNVNENEGTYFIHFESGKRVYQLYAELDRGDTDNPHSLANFLKAEGNSDYSGPWAFPTLGGAGGQTVFGALNTGTHGGDHRQAPISDAVVALHLVADGGKHYWIEPEFFNAFESPLTDEDRVTAVYGVDEFGGKENFQFIRNTDMFNAVLVSAGRFGVVFSVVMKAVRQYCLHEERRIKDWKDVKLLINDLNSDLYKLPTAVAAPAPATGANRFLQVAVSLTPYGFFTRNLAGITKRWNIPAVPDATNPNGRMERAGVNAGSSVSYTPDPDKPDQAKPIGFLERACSSANFIDGVIEAVAFEIKEFVEDNTVAIGGTVAAVAAVAGTAGLLALAAALTLLLAALFAFLAALRASGNARLGQTIDDLRSLLLDHDDPDLQAAGVFIWQCIYYKLFKSQQEDLDYGAISYAVMDLHNYLDLSCNVNVDSIEVFFDASDQMLIAYIDALIAFETAQEYQGRSFGGYASLRFMGSSQALLGMQRWPVTCSVEIAGLKDVNGTKELIDYAISLALNNNYRAILHWGQRNTSTVQNIEDRFGNTALVRAGELQTWREALKRITEDGRFTGFSSAFTRQTGLEI